MTINIGYAATTDTLNQAKKDMNLGRYAAAAIKLNQFVEQKPSHYEAWFLFGVAHVHQQQYHQAIEAFRQVIRLRPDLAEPHNNLAAVYSNLDDTQAAIKELKIALEKRSDYPVAEENLADLYVKLALRHYKKSLRYASNPIVEQRYARLVKVRNPLTKPVHITTKEGVVTASAKVEISERVPQVEPQEKSNPLPATAAKKTSDKQKTVAHIDIEDQSQQPLQQPSVAAVLAALEIWRSAWASQDLDHYFSAYAKDYEPDTRFKSIVEWKAYKTRVIQNKTFINIDFEQVDATFSPRKDYATVQLLQHFRSNSYQGDSLKKVTLKHTAQGWKIIHEVSIQ